MATPDVQVVTIKSLVANAFIVCAQRTMIVDTGNPGNAPRILRRMEQLGIAPRTVSLILLTHGHLDHFGSVHELHAATGAPIAIHPLDAPALRAGINPPLAPSCAMGHVLKPFFQHRRIGPCEPDLLVDETTSLEPFGVPGQIVHTPGHTPGSISLLLASGDLLAGDLILGGYLGGHIASRRPGLPYFLDDLKQTRRSVQRILDLPLNRVHVGHGGPLDPVDIRRALAE
jgi:glyoxylase-like metal-dependent hydrolase (beta-lactamase superfamily II)